MRRLILVLSLVLALVAGAPAQQATAGTFGYGCPSPPSETTLSYVGLPQLGGTFTVTYRGPTWSGGRASIWAHLLTGSSDRNFFGLSLPVRAGDWIGGIGAWHCQIWTSSEWYTAFTSGYPTGQVQLSVPLDSRLVGVRLYQQWIIEWGFCYQNVCEGRVFTSNGGVITLGY